MEIKTDTDAEAALPPHPLAQKQYKAYRQQGETPALAFAHSLEDWRAFWSANCFVPHRQ